LFDNKSADSMNIWVDELSSSMEKIDGTLFSYQYEWYRLGEESNENQEKALFFVQVNKNVEDHGLCNWNQCNDRFLKWWSLSKNYFLR